MKIAQFKTGADSTTICEEETGKFMTGIWVQLTEYAEVNFIPLPVDQVVEGQLNQIDAAEQRLRKQFQEKLDELTEARSKLLSLTHQSEPL